MCLIEFRSKNIYTRRIHRVCTCVQKEFFCVTGYIRNFFYWIFFFIF